MLPPPTRWASATVAPSTCRPVASPRSCSTASCSMAMPVGPPGCPRASSPPSVLNGMRPPGPVSPSTTSFSRLALGAEPEQLVVLELLVHEGVVAVGDAHVLGPEAGRLVALEGGVARHGWRGRPPGRRRCGPASSSPTSAPRPGRAPTGGPAGAARTRSSRATMMQAAPSSGGQHIMVVRGSATMRAASTSSAVTTWSDWRCASRALGAVVPVLGRDRGEVLGRRAALVHAALRPQREVGRRAGSARRSGPAPRPGRRRRPSCR